MRRIGYARVSTGAQDTALQLDALRRSGCTHIFEDIGSGSTREGRPQLVACLSFLRPGDVLVVYKIDRVARSLFDLLSILRQLESIGASIYSCTEPLDTSSSMGLFMVQVLGAVAQLERSMIRERCIAGQRAAAARGVKLGRPRIPDDVRAAIVRESQSGRFTQKEVAARFGIHPKTVREILRGK